ncbi:hypothetical protein BGZ58_003747 [Dissophora ornata]|nr:hypothetical protein BGZ58_003747 [Dissophora ornata]
MYEPHWSAVNRYLEISELDSDSHSTTELNNGLNEIPHQQHQSDQVTEGSHIKGGSEPILLQYASPTSPLSPTPTIRRGVPHLPGAVPDNWGHMNDPQNIHDAGAGPSGTSALSVRGSVIKKGTTNSRGADAGVANLSGTLGVATNTRRSTNIKRAITLGTSGVTKEDLQESAERIYYKYLTPQAETPVRIPNSVRRRVAQLMDSKIMIGPAAAVASGATSKRKNTMDTANLANAPFSPPMISPTSPIPNSSDKLKVAPRSDPHHPHRNSNNSSNNNNNSLQQPDQDLGLVFAEAREIVFEGMESYYFPRFIEARVYGNMVHSHRVARAVLGLVFGVSEAKWMQFGKIKEPHIMMLHRKRAVKVVVVALLYTICVGAIFGIVPGHRL